MRRVAAGDTLAVHALSVGKLPRILSLAARMLGDAAEAEDVAQDAFLRLWRHAHRWRQGPARLDTWLHRVTLNLCYDRLRRRREVPMAEPPEQIENAPAQDAVLFSQDLSRQVQAALSALPLRQREAVILVHYQDLTNIQAAEIMSVSVDALESLLSRARRKLRADLLTANL